MISIQDHAEGCIVPVRAQPGARKDRVMGEQNSALKIAVTAPPEDGRANKALIELLHEVLGVKRNQIELISGDKSRDKRFLIRGVEPNALAAKIGQLLS